MSRVAIVIALVLVLGPAFASEPGQPLDCTDIVFEVPGLSCRPFRSFDVPYDDHFYAKGHDEVIDNEGHLTIVRNWNYPAVPPRVEIRQHDGTNDQLIAWFPDRFVPPGNFDRLRTRDHRDTFLGSNVVNDGLLFDPLNGRLLVPLVSECQGACPCGSGPCSGSGYGGRWIAAIEGFATLYEIRQSYEPVANRISFAVPVMPEGMGGADHFDTYWGNLTKPIDFTQAQPLQCNYPASPPQVGDYVTVNDPLPNPVAGTGRYYVTAATYQGRTRYGRRAQGGVLSGRDPSLLPACVQPETR